jgi:nitrate/nitrite-specific signal transduction histidine kinase
MDDINGVNCYAKDQNNLGVGCYEENGNHAVALGHFRNALAAKLVVENRLSRMPEKSQASFHSVNMDKLTNIDVPSSRNDASTPIEICASDWLEFEGKEHSSSLHDCRKFSLFLLFRAFICFMLKNKTKKLYHIYIHIRLQSMIVMLIHLQSMIVMLRKTHLLPLRNLYPAHHRTLSKL